MSLPPDYQPFPEDEEDLRRKAEIEGMMRSQREFYFRNEPVQQEYRDVVTRLADREEARNNPVATGSRQPGPFDLALAQYLKKRAGEGEATPAFTPASDASSLFDGGESEARLIFRRNDEIPDRPPEVLPDAGVGKGDRLPVSRPQLSPSADETVDRSGTGPAKPSTSTASLATVDVPHRWDGTQRVEELQGDQRYRPYSIKQALKDQINYAAQKNGLKVEVHSGGQVPVGQPGKRYPNNAPRHDNGDAADVKLYEITGGQKCYLNGDNANDRKRMASVIEDAVRVGVTGVGYGYMGPETIHLGGGKENVWSSMKKTGTPPHYPPPVPWVFESVQRGRTARNSVIKSGAWPNVVGPAVPGVTVEEPWGPTDAYSLDRKR